MAEKKITEASVLALYRDEKITLSRGAQLLNIPIQDFMELLNAQGIYIDDVTPEEMDENMETMRALRKKYEQAKPAKC